MRQPQFFQLHQMDAAPLVAEAQAGLLQPRAHVSPKFFYDALGSNLFGAITELDEYYPTRTEATIFQEQGPALAQAVQRAVGRQATMVELGAGSCTKAARLLQPLALARYVAVDISVDFLRESLARVQAQHPELDMVGVGLDFSAQLALPPGLVEGPALVFYPGSSIGNFTPDAALRLLHEACVLAQGGALLIGVDLVKPAELLELAYDDALGVTAAFNLNLLRHLNRLLGANFDPRQWQHVALYNRTASRIEMHLQARTELTVCWPGGERRFEAGERIHTENSYKWRQGDFEALLRDAGFAQVQTFTDARGWFAVMLASQG